ncbi:endothelial cell-specific chemotaxis regulator isoform X2 [Suricata suricatta]|uniref:endothelial cell-specific chemotaxis regulator isoform X2 n=1 Tax=Suricata suricatta TaxID=37032 RepID=UPI001155E3D7|nr:endothelial cell-specific chemotaxis regulator isoform X2 [Suricata suricatta]
MGTVGATQLCWVILGFHLLQGHHSQPTTIQTSSLQGAFSSQNLTTEPLSYNTAPEETSQVLEAASKPGTQNMSTVDGHSQALLGLTGSQPQKLASELNASQDVTPTSATMSLRMREDSTILPSPTSETVLTVAAFGVISFIVILVVVVIILVSVVSLRFKCRKTKESEDPQKPGSSGLSESCSTANGEKESITLISMKNINMNNSKGCPPAEKVL